jgi:hypothetical protein
LGREIRTNRSGDRLATIATRSQIFCLGDLVIRLE